MNGRSIVSTAEIEHEQSTSRAKRQSGFEQNGSSSRTISALKALTAGKGTIRLCAILVCTYYIQLSDPMPQADRSISSHCGL